MEEYPCVGSASVSSGFIYLSLRLVNEIQARKGVRKGSRRTRSSVRADRRLIEEKERGQARLPDPELNFFEYDYSIERLSESLVRNWESLSGQEGGLAPALFL